MLQLMGMLVYDWYGCVTTCVAEQLSQEKVDSVSIFLFRDFFFQTAPSHLISCLLNECQLTMLDLIHCSLQATSPK